MAKSIVELLGLWDASRHVNVENECGCLNCCKSSNVCNKCKNWSQNIWFNSKNALPNIKCSDNNCNNSYHLKCLSLRYRQPNSWKTCSDIGSKCMANIDFFSFFHTLNVNQTYIDNNNELILSKYQQIFPNKSNIKIFNHFEGFIYNNYIYVIRDCVAVNTNDNRRRNYKRICRILDIFSTSYGDSMILIQWYYSTSYDGELFIDNNMNNNIEITWICNVCERVIVNDSRKDYLSAKKQLIHLKKKRKKEIINNKNNNKCFKDNDTISALTFNQIFYSNRSFDPLTGVINNDGNKQITYKTSNKLQKQILINNNNNNNNNNLSENDSDSDSDDDDDDVPIIQIINSNNNKNKKRKFNEIEHNNSNINQNVNKKRRITQNNNNNNDNSDDSDSDSDDSSTESESSSSSSSSDYVLLNEYKEMHRSSKQKISSIMSHNQELISQINKYSNFDMDFSCELEESAKRLNENINILINDNNNGKTKIRNLKNKINETKKEINILIEKPKTERACIRTKTAQIINKNKNDINIIKQQIKQKDDQIRQIKILQNNNVRPSSVFR